MKSLFRSLFLTCALLLSPLAARADHHDMETAPKSVIHVVTVAWKSEATPDQIAAALAGVHQLAADFPGITRVWTRAIKVQSAPGVTLPRTHAFVMEFKDEQALSDYAGSDAQKKWYETYQIAREASTTFDITN